MSRIMKIARRGFLLGSIAVAGGVAFGWWRYGKLTTNPLEADMSQGQFTMNPYVVIDSTGVTVVTPRAEMGQGVQSTLAALVAEEMDLDWNDIRVIHGPPSRAYYNAAVLQEGVPFAPTDTGWLAEAVRAGLDIPAKLLGLQITGGSSSIPDAYEKMRLAGAAARAALMEAAARRLNLTVADLSTEAGAVVAPNGTRLPYTTLAEDAAGIDLAREPDLKPRSEWRLLGQSLPRPDMLAKVTGTAVFAVDLRLPGMRFATVRTNPRQGAPLLSFDASEAEAMIGVERIVPVENGLAVVATSTWTAMQAANTIRYEWAEAPYPATSAAVDAVLMASFSDDHRDSRNRDDGDVEAVLTAGDWEAEYSVPYLAHATMEAMSSAALLKDGRLTIWTGHQLPSHILPEASSLTGLPEEAIRVEVLPMGGGFGRRAEMDVIRQVITVAKAMEGTPVLLTWSREEDMTHDGYRPAARAKVRARLDGQRLFAFDFSTCSSSVVESQAGRLGYSLPGPDGAIVQGAWEQPYRIPHHRVTGYRAPAMLPVGSWRSVGASQNAFFHETAMDELAHEAGMDAVAFRLAMIDHLPSRHVIEAVAEMSGWGRSAPGRAKGFAFCMSFGVPTAEVIEVEDTPAGLRMTGAWAAVDVGTALDPRNIEAQVQGGMIYGLSAAIRGEITLADGEVQQTNFWDYEPLRLSECPPIAVRVLENLPKIRGIGEPGTPPAAPALGNAIFALTGQRLRDLPFARTTTFA